MNVVLVISFHDKFKIVHLTCRYARVVVVDVFVDMYTILRIDECYGKFNTVGVLTCNIEQ